MKTVASYRWIILLPLLYSLVLPLVNYFYIASHAGELSTTGRQLLSIDSGHLLWAAFLLLLPNTLLSFFLVTYRNSRPDHPGEALFLCLVSMAGGTLPVLGIYVLYYYDVAVSGGDVTGLMYGFPMAYLLGMMTTWFVGAILMQARR